MTTAQNDDLPALLEIAASLARDGDHQRALQVYNDILAESPRNSDALTGKGRSLFALGRYEQAVRFLQRASEGQPSRPGVLRLLGVSALSAGDGEAALASYARLQKLGAEPAENYLNLAKAAYFALDLERARGYVDLSLAENPSLEAARTWEARLNAIPDHPAFLIDVGRAHCRQGRFDKGLALLLQSLSQSDSAAGHLYAGRALLALRRTPEAIEHLQRARQMDEGAPGVLTDLATAYALTGNADTAMGLYELALALDHNDVQALLGKASLLLESSDRTADANKAVDRLVELEPQNPETWFLRARIRVREGDRQAVRLLIEKAIVCDVRSPLVWQMAADLFDTIDEPGLSTLCRARALFADTGDSSPPSDKLVTLLGYENGVTALARAGLLEEQIVEALRNRATVFANLGEVDHALSYLDLLIERFPAYETEELARHRGSLLLKKHDPAGARTAFERALELDPRSQRARLGIQRLDALAV